eukprot:gnl/MRDRNA2_/MRDRNA2_20282_c0_seq1.p3 gnl/MRDRNA2_/MRDRNA2_20282_c0~~gnl/MRDRNA2_/MRDRNA2_20282_c0_seq1.p3  ORF type:complete len:109 (-),score=16.71 gnl/MRDRNA2_/MRDRNA2_20282_c0_seq1:40-366(-)
MINIPGRVYHAGLPREVDEEVMAMLRPTFRHMSRDDHAERMALIHVVTQVLDECRAGTSVLSELAGALQLYTSHFPCISCMAVIGQFAGLCPLVRIEVEYDAAWSIWD